MQRDIVTIHDLFWGKSAKFAKSWNKGTIVTRTWGGDLSTQDYLAMLSRGDCRLHAHPPDTYTADGVPVYFRTEEELFAAQEELDRECDTFGVLENIACNAGRTNVLNYIGNTIDQGVRYFSVGTGAGTPSASDTAMFNDFFRKAPTAITLTGNQVLFSTNFLTSEANTTYTEAGLFGGSTAVVTPGGAGTMFAHAAYAYTKTSSITLTNDYFIQLS